MHVQRLVFGICALAGYIYCDIAIELCDTVRLSCSARDGCQMALTNFFVGCNDVIYGKGNKCTTKCEHALISLLSTEDKAGLAFMNCNCSGNALCEERKARVEVCTRVVLKSMTHLENKDHSISCNLAQWICEADTACLTALDYYAQHCSKLLLADKCTSRCNNSLQILYRQKNAKKLPNCYCDGKEEYDCYKLKYNTEKYCFHKEPNIPYVDNRSRKPSHSSHKNSGRKDKPRRKRKRRWFRSSHQRLRKMLKKLLKGHKKRRRSHLKRRRRRDRRRKRKRSHRPRVRRDLFSPDDSP